MTALFDPEKHEPLTARAWDEEAARDAVRRIAGDAHRAYDRELQGWPADREDTEGDDAKVYDNLHMGTAGVVWALDRLAQLGVIDEGPHYALEPLIERSRRFSEPRGRASLLMGDTGILLTEWRRTREERLLDVIADRIAENAVNPSRELTWGAPGTMLAALFLHDETGEARWRELFVRSAERLLSQWEPCPSTSVRLWNQQLQGLSFWSLGVGHGFAGNALALVRGRALLGDRSKAVIDELARTAAATRCAEGASWQKYVGPVLPEEMAPHLHAGRRLLHVCHGAPGFVIAFAPARHPELHALLVDAGEVVWSAGPLRNGSGICHGTAGNAYAFLALWRRTGDRGWLDRGRRFAMHAMERSEERAARTGQRRWSLWTGDLGVACLLWDCVRERSDFPTIDVFF